ncbi:MAG TPA: ABC transporter permease [Dehalococcoidia bacterium]|nr:ABC transporter permease [Dehalococcoidia bacterium]
MSDWIREFVSVGKWRHKMSANAVDPIFASEVPPTAISSLLREVRAVGKTVRGFISLLGLSILVLFAVLVPLLWGMDPNWIENVTKNQSPSWEHPMGTDHISRDLLARNASGLGRTVIIGVGAVISGWIVGIALGYVAGWRGGLTDIFIMRGVDTLLAFPGILIAIVVLTILGGGILPLGIAIAIFNISGMARLARAGVLRERERDYVTAARCLGATERRILWRHVSVNTFGAFAVALPLAVVASVLTMAALNYLGLGTAPPDATLGQLLLDGGRYMRFAPHYVLGPVVLLAMLLLSLNFLSDVMSERLDPIRRRDG